MDGFIRIMSSVFPFCVLFQSLHSSLKEEVMRCVQLLIQINTELCSRHLIGFFLFLFLTIYTAMKVPHYSLPEILRKADLHIIQSKLAKCIPSLSNIPDFGKLRGEFKASLPSLHSLSSSLSQWHIVEYISNCFPERFSNIHHVGDHSLVMFHSSVYLLNHY